MTMNSAKLEVIHALIIAFYSVILACMLNSTTAGRVIMPAAKELLWFSITYSEVLEFPSVSLSHLTTNKRETIEHNNKGM